MAQAYPNTTVAGSDYHNVSIELARKRAAEVGVADRVTFEVASAQAFSGRGYDLVTSFDCLHDMGDPVGAARHVRDTLAPDGTWMIVEPAAEDRVEDNSAGRSDLLLGVDHGVPARRAAQAGQRPRRASRQGRDQAGGHRGRLQPVSAHRDSRLNAVYKARP